MVHPPNTTAHERSVKPPHGPLLYRAVRAGFVARGTTLSEWCRTYGIARQHAERALLFRSNGPKARELRRRVAEAAGIEWL